MGDEDSEGSVSYVLVQIRYMCEVVMKKVKTYEHLLGTNSNEGLKSEILDLISFMEKNCQVLNERCEHFHQNFKTKGYPAKSQQRSTSTNEEFYRPLSAVYKNELNNNVGIRYLQNGIKQESEEVEKSPMCEYHDLENTTAEGLINQENLNKSTCVPNIFEDISHQDNRDASLELLLPSLCQTVYDESTPLLISNNTNTHESNVENKTEDYPIADISCTTILPKEKNSVDITMEGSLLDAPTFNDNKSDNSIKRSYTEQEIQNALKELDMNSSHTHASDSDEVSLSEVGADSEVNSLSDYRSESPHGSYYTDDLLLKEDSGDDSSFYDSFNLKTDKGDCSISSFSENNKGEHKLEFDTLSKEEVKACTNEPDLGEVYKNQHNIEGQKPPGLEQLKHITDISSPRNLQNHVNKNDDDAVNRLCNSLDETKSQKSEHLCETKKLGEKNTSLTDIDFSVMSGHQNIDECLQNDVDEHYELRNVETDQYLADIVCKTIKDVDDLYNSDIGSSEPINRKKNSMLNRGESKSETTFNNFSSHDKNRSSNDPLLTSNLSINENLMPKKSMENDSKKRNINYTNNIKVKQREKEFGRVSEFNADEDMGVRFYKEYDRGTNTNNKKMHSETSISTVNQSVQGSELNCENNPKRGRKNIRSVLTYEELTEATKRTEKEEEQRSWRIQQRQQLLSSHSSEEGVFILDTTKEGETIKVDPLLNKKLYPHQRKGVMFMWQSCYESVERLQHFSGLGCILAHCMGLGKSFQVFTLIHTLFSHPVTNMKHCLIICPVSTIITWKKEIESGLELSQNKIAITLEYIEGGDNVVNKCIKINRWRKHSGILLMGYEAFVHIISGKSVVRKIEKKLIEALLDPGPDLVICDEGHLLKNGKAKKTQALSKIKTKRRIILSGTPMQNNLSEYYYMVNFVNPNILGTFKEYYNRFVQPITNGQYLDSTKEDIILMKKRSHVLHELLRNTIQRFEVSELNKYLKPIKNYTLFIQLHPVQSLLYSYFIEQAKQHFITSSGKTTNLFDDMNVAKYICSHPHLLSIMEEQVNLKKNRRDVLLNGEQNVLKVDYIRKNWWKSICSENDLRNIDCGPKLKLTLAIIEEAEKLGEKILVFTSSLVELESLEYFLKEVGTSGSRVWRYEIDYFRLDGSVKPTKRAEMCTNFNHPENKQLRVLLISYKVGGVGLSLTAANRVVILGSVFNPVHDTQSIYRCYRFGQTKIVYVYRLISMGTMEEKIYRSCVSKLALAGRVVDKQQIGRHYDLSEIKQFYKNNVDLNIPRKLPSRPDDNLLATLISRFHFLHKYVDHQGLLENKPEDDLNDEEKIRAWEEFRRECEENLLPRLVDTLAEKPLPITRHELTETAGPSRTNDLSPKMLKVQDDLSHHNSEKLLPFTKYIKHDRNKDFRPNKTIPKLSELNLNENQLIEFQNKLELLNIKFGMTKKPTASLSTTSNETKSLEQNMIVLNKGVAHKSEEKVIPIITLSEKELAASSVVHIQNNKKNAEKIHDIIQSQIKKNHCPLPKKIDPNFKFCQNRAKLLTKLKNVGSTKKNIKQIIPNTTENNEKHNLSWYKQSNIPREAENTLIQGIAKKIENLKNITVRPVTSLSGKLNTDITQKQKESSTSCIQGKNQALSSIKPSTKCGSTEPNVILNKTRHRDGILVKKCENIRDQKASTISKLVKAQKGSSRECSSNAKRILKQTDVIKKPHNSIQFHPKDNLLKISAKKKLNIITKNDNKKKDQCVPLFTFENSRCDTSSDDHNSIQSNYNFSRTCVKRSYPYSSEETQHYPLDLSDKQKRDKTSESNSNIVKNKSLNRSRLPTYKKSDRPVPFSMQKTKPSDTLAISIKKRKVVNTNNSRSLISKHFDQSKTQANKLLGLKKSRLNSKIMNINNKDANKISNSNPTIASSTSNSDQAIHHCL